MDRALDLLFSPLLLFVFVASVAWFFCRRSGMSHTTLWQPLQPVALESWWVSRSGQTCKLLPNENGTCMRISRDNARILAGLFTETGKPLLIEMREYYCAECSSGDEDAEIRFFNKFAKQIRLVSNRLQVHVSEGWGIIMSAVRSTAA